MLIQEKLFGSLRWVVSEEQVPYEQALSLMQEYHADVLNGNLDHQIWLLEHPDTITIGTSGQEADVLQAQSIPVFHISRGGKATYHGPGQRIIYPFFNMHKIFPKDNLDIKKFVFALESWIIATLKTFGIEGKVYDNRIGVWVDTPGRYYPFEQAKIAAIGIKVSKWVSFHGISVNLFPDLNKFNQINPCGLKDYGITSLKDLGLDITLNEFDEALIKNFFKFEKILA
ncbi:lipoyl(octanoyl) transferase LipB [Rickettsiales endosymbiont of Stachyamoeba lipophora]|uniref:lipoyl(octanoyl) transferase LipB n=1 Tax=Rickettsiales endosymbiont of Stachyamoeba lipophora TaxID=2486578 RepID=UPI000F64DB85|nr:lipoyl(octanoyl) transferase LipB [Rickettsiales endosymbiont of Stachyamoeba lipophora]AZL15846.1 lipoyl(octanoyl) transferase LipB [Rickettsiales endosymbiont of Stachyamoeba lipophora]